MRTAVSSKLFASLTTLVVVLFVASLATAAPVVGSQQITGNRSTAQYTDSGNTYGPYGWNYSYTRGFNGTSFYKDIEVNFQFDDGVFNNNAQTQAAWVQSAITGLQGIWDNKWSIKDNQTGKLYPIIVEITTAAPFNQTVQVHASTGSDPDDPNPAGNDADRSDMTSWYTGNTASTNAHEVGHMMGLFDEYIGGAVNQYPNPTLSNDGLMGLGALNANPVMYQRYYQQFADYANTVNDPGNTAGYSLQAVPEPATLALLVVAGACLTITQRRWRNAA
jgi:hypothetical protein